MSFEDVKKPAEASLLGNSVSQDARLSRLNWLTAFPKLLVEQLLECRRHWLQCVQRLVQRLCLQLSRLNRHRPPAVVGALGAI